MNAQPTILIVDDTPENLTVLRDILSRGGFRVRPVLQGALALKSATAEPPDLILLDVMMPGIDGYQTCEALKANEATAEIPVLFISALDTTESKLRGFEVGGLDYVTKPFRSEEVLARVRTHVALREAQRLLAKQNEELREAALLREDLDRILRHDLRGSLSNIIGYSELLTEEVSLDKTASEHAQTIVDAGYTMLSMVHSSFDLAKMERGVYELRPEPCDLVSTVRRVWREMGLEAERKNLRHHFTFADPGAEDAIALGERLLCHSLFHNLVKNAIEAAPPGSALEIHFGAEDHQLTARLRNEGAVPEAVRERFFDKFATSGKPEGTGLGTYSAKLMAETQGGGLRVDTSEPGHTTVIVTLPAPSPLETDKFREARARAQMERARFQSPDFAPGRLLIADDDPANRAYLERILPSPPFQLTFAVDGREALAALQEPQEFSAAILDLEMPEIGGLDAARGFLEWRRARGSTDSGPFLIALSSHQGAAMRQHCLEAGFDRVLTKPISKRALLEELKHGLSGSTAVCLDREIADLVPGFLEMQRRLMEQIEAGIEQHDDGALRALAHRLQGSFSMYGFHAASHLATRLEETGKTGDFARGRELLDELRGYLTSLKFYYT